MKVNRAENPHKYHGINGCDDKNITFCLKRSKFEDAWADFIRFYSANTFINSPVTNH